MIFFFCQNLRQMYNNDTAFKSLLDTSFSRVGFPKNFSYFVHDQICYLLTKKIGVNNNCQMKRGNKGGGQICVIFNRKCFMKCAVHNKIFK